MIYIYIYKYLYKCSCSRSLTVRSATGVTVVTRGTNILSHEIGHNLGLDHDVDTPGNPLLANSYAHGFVNIEAKKRTIMSYSLACDKEKIYCPIINVFSNPDYEHTNICTFFHGPDCEEKTYVMGDAETADNARVIEENWKQVANYKNAAAKTAQMAKLVEALQ